MTRTSTQKNTETKGKEHIGRKQNSHNRIMNVHGTGIANALVFYHGWSYSENKLIEDTRLPNASLESHHPYQECVQNSIASFKGIGNETILHGRTFCLYRNDSGSSKIRTKSEQHLNMVKKEEKNAHIYL